MLSRIVTMFLGKFESKDEVKKFSLLGLIFGLIIGTYWAFRPIKDSIFASMVGIDYQPMAKWLSLCIIVPLVILYGKLIDKFPRHKVFYALSLIYGAAAIGFWYYFSHPVYGLTNTMEDPTRILGWLWYIYVESFGSLIVALFWAFTADITKPDAAKRGFPVIALFGQTGNIVGPLLLTADRLGFETSAPIVAIAGVCMLLMAVLMWVFMRVVPASQLVGFEMEPNASAKKEHDSEPGFLEGLKLLFSQGYLLGIFMVISIYEIIITILDFQLKAMAKAQYPTEKAMAAYLSGYAVWVGIIATACVLLGINNIQRYLGMTWSLISLPILVAFAVVALWISPTLSVVFWIMVLSKAVNYALNQPTMKQLYIPTSKDAKYKSQAWMEMFGSRGAKAGGSAVNYFRGNLISAYGKEAGLLFFLNLSTGSSLAMIVVWLFIALYVAKKYNHAIDNNQIIC